MLEDIIPNTPTRVFEEISCVYAATHNGKDFYIGATKNFRGRAQKHRSAARLSNHYVKEFNGKNIQFFLIKETETPQKYEGALIKEIGLNNLLNKSDKDGQIRKFSEEEIHQIIDLYNSGKSACFIAEHIYKNRDKRAIISMIIQGKIYAEYNHLINKRKYSQLGRVLSQETKEKIGASNKGISKNSTLTEEQVRNIRNSKTSNGEAAKLFGLNKSTIKDIRKRRTYKYYL